MGSGYRTFYPGSTDQKKQNHKKSNVSFQSSKIFPPTPDDLPTEEGNPAESETATEEAPAAVSEDTTTTSEPQSKKLKTSTTEAEDLGKDDDWEAVEKPTASDETAAVAAVATDMSEGEGEKVEAVESDGEKVEKPVVDAEEKQTKGGAVLPENNMLAKDW